MEHHEMSSMARLAEDPHQCPLLVDFSFNFMWTNLGNNYPARYLNLKMKSLCGAPNLNMHVKTR